MEDKGDKGDGMRKMKIEHGTSHSIEEVQNVRQVQERGVLGFSGK